MIQFKHLSKSYKDHTLFEDFDFSINSGDFVTIVGKSGSGKSSLLNIIGMFDNEYLGEYYYQDQLVNHLKLSQKEGLRKQDIGYIFQNYNLINEYTVIENVELPLGYRKVKKKDRRRICLEALESLGLKEKINKHPQTLSGGEQQRVSIARTLVMQPKLLLADEPTGSVDEQTATDIMEIFAQMNQEGVTIVLVTHDPQLAKLGNKRLEILDRKIIQRD